MSFGGILGQTPDLKTLNSQVVITGNQQNVLEVENTVGATDIDFQAQSATGSITLNTNNTFNISRPTTIAGNISSTGNFIGTGGNNGAAQVTYNNSATSTTITSNTVQGAIDQLFTSVSNGKELIADAITDKGGSISGSASFEELAGAIENISSEFNLDNLSNTIMRAFATITSVQTMQITWPKIERNYLGLIYYINGSDQLSINSDTTGESYNWITSNIASVANTRVQSTNFNIYKCIISIRNENNQWRIYINDVFLVGFTNYTTFYCATGGGRASAGITYTYLD